MSVDDDDDEDVERGASAAGQILQFRRSDGLDLVAGSILFRQRKKDRRSLLSLLSPVPKWIFRLIRRSAAFVLLRVLGTADLAGRDSSCCDGHDVLDN